MKTTREQHPTILAVLRVKPFLFLWISQILSQIAFNMLNFVLVLRVYQLTSSNVAVSALVLFFLLPQLILSLFAGVLVDRFEKKLVMLLTNSGRALSLVPLLLLPSELMALYIGAFTISIATQFFLPAEVPMIPKLLPKKLLLSANSLFTVTLYGSIIIGYVLAGPMLKFFGVTTVFLILALLFLFAAGFNWFLPGKNGGAYLKNQFERFSKVTHQRVLHVLFNDIGEVLYLILKSPTLLSAIALLTLSQTVIVILGALVPGYTATILSLDVEDSSLLILAPAAFGMIVGSFLQAVLAIRIRKNFFIMPSLIMSGLMLILLPIFSRVANPNVFVSVYSYLPFDLIIPVIATCFFVGFFNALIVVPSNTILQETSTEAIRGRIYGFFNCLSALAALIPLVLAGYFSDVFGVGKVLTTIGIAIMVLGLTVVIRK